MNKDKAKVLLHKITNHFFLRNKGIFRVTIKQKKSTIKRTFFSIPKNKNLNLVLGDFSYLIDSNITSIGNNNLIIIHDNTTLKNCYINIVGDDSVIEIGSKTWMLGSSLFLAEKNKVTIGDECLFSSNVSIWTHDGHDVIDLKSKQSINKAKDIVIGNHVWVCQDVLVLKGSVIGNGSIVSAKSLVNKSFNDNSLIGGVPSTLLKADVTWK